MDGNEQEDITSINRKEDLAPSESELETGNLQENIRVLETALEQSDPRTGFLGLKIDDWVEDRQIWEYMLYDGFSPSNPGHRPSDLRPWTVMADAYGKEPKENEPDMMPIQVDDGWIWQQNKEKWAEYNSLLNNPDTTLGQLRDFYIEAFKAAYIAPMKNKINPPSHI